MKSNLSAACLFLALASLLPLDALSNTDCTDALGVLTFHEKSYSGGAAPPPGSEIHRTEWLLAGKTVLREIECTAERDPLPPESTMGSGKCGDGAEGRIEDSDLVARFIGPETVLYQSSPNDGPFTLRKYLVKAEMFRKSGKPIPNGTKRYEDFVLCQHLQVYYP